MDFPRPFFMVINAVFSSENIEATSDIISKIDRRFITRTLRDTSIDGLASVSVLTNASSPKIGAADV